MRQVCGPELPWPGHLLVCQTRKNSCASLRSGLGIGATAAPFLPSGASGASSARVAPIRKPTARSGKEAPAAECKAAMAWLWSDDWPGRGVEGGRLGQPK